MSLPSGYPQKQEWRAAKASASALVAEDGVKVVPLCATVETTLSGESGDAIFFAYELVGRRQRQEAVVCYSRKTQWSGLLARGPQVLLPELDAAVASLMGEKTAAIFAQHLWSQLIYADMRARREYALGYLEAQRLAARSLGVMRVAAAKAGLADRENAAPLRAVDWTAAEIAVLSAARQRWPGNRRIVCGAADDANARTGPGAFFVLSDMSLLKSFSVWEYRVESRATTCLGDQEFNEVPDLAVVPTKGPGHAAVTELATAFWAGQILQEVESKRYEPAGFAVSAYLATRATGVLLEEARRAKVIGEENSPASTVVMRALAMLPRESAPARPLVALHFPPDSAEAGLILLLQREPAQSGVTIAVFDAIGSTLVHFRGEESIHPDFPLALEKLVPSPTLDRAASLFWGWYLREQKIAQETGSLGARWDRMTPAKSTGRLRQAAREIGLVDLRR